ncbi:huntingtin-interacting protein K-like [Saccoglossus kowalevskii]|uniref:Huntingtin-interacting protein K-like n=1 Tax=Saccoglossus kowalevskii TaxID=10224 RepID=A0ABM0GWG3_SACKO|nr:PREDICTED: huntingtin-interacting protein K-like [Saccoglossus kowalevskii]
MATPSDGDVEQKQAVSSSKAKKHDSGAADLEKVTDYHEEMEIVSQDMTDAMSHLGDKIKKEKAARAQREQELAKVKVRKEDVDLVVNEMEIPKFKAERILKEHNGDLVATLTALTD